jgi:uncharacterized membrane protein YgcG
LEHAGASAQILSMLCAVVFAAATTCDNSSFPVALHEVQCYGLQHEPSASASAAACQDACCARGAARCSTWQLAAAAAATPTKGCFLGVPSHCLTQRNGWDGRAMTPSPIRLDRTAPGRRFDGVGAIVDASSRFLADYPPAQREQIYDLLFSPSFGGAALSLAKLEIGGDAQQTDGSSASYRHVESEDPNFNRTHIWEVALAAKARFPEIGFYGLGWGFPGWLGSFYSNATAEYLAGWVAGAKGALGLDVGTIGLWNERDPCRKLSSQNKGGGGSGGGGGSSGGGGAGKVVEDCSIVADLRRALDRVGMNGTRIAAGDGKASAMGPFLDPQQVPAGWALPPIGVVATHGAGVLDPALAAAADARGLPRWRSEGEETYISSAALASHLVRDYVEANVTATIEWPIVQGFYPQLPWGEHDMFFGAHEPWSGHFGVPSSVWVFAHLGQFARPGWRYLAQGGGRGGGSELYGGGTYSALVSPDGADLTLLIETQGAPNCSASNCATGDQNATFVLPSSVHRPPTAEVWRSELATNAPGRYFLRQPDVALTPVGNMGAVTLQVTLQLPLNTLTTLTTRSSADTRPPARKGTDTMVPPPAPTPFPLPYAADYSALPRFRQGPFHVDQQGSFEIDDVELAAGAAPNNEAAAGRVLRGLVQTVSEYPVSWVFATPRPLTMFGGYGWSDVTARAVAAALAPATYANTTLFDCSQQRAFTVKGEATRLPTPLGGAFVEIGVRCFTGGNICNAGKLDTRGYFFRVHANATFSVTRGSQAVLAAGLLPPLALRSVLAKRQRQPPRRASAAAALPLLGVLLELEFTAKGTELTAVLNGHAVAQVHDSHYPTGMVSLGCGWHRSMFANVSVSNASNASTPSLSFE